MTFYVENLTKEEFDFDVEELIASVCNAALEEEKCPYEVQINLVMTNNEGIREWNRKFRGIDKETDVLSFPNLDFLTPGIYEIKEECEADYFDPETGELILGDIMISVDKVKEQASEYGHSIKREFAFLVAHSILHLSGYDHMDAKEARIMEEKQEAILSGLGITRDK